MARYGNRKAKSQETDSRYRSSGSKKSYGKSSKRGKGGDAEFICLGDLTTPKSRSDDDDYQELIDDAMELETAVNFKVFLGDNDFVKLCNGDRVMVKFKKYKESPDFVVGKAFLIVED